MWSQILAQNRDFCVPHLHSTPPLGGPRRNIAMTFGVNKLEWCGYPMIKIVEDTFILFDRQNHRQTPHEIRSVSGGLKEYYISIVFYHSITF